VASTSGDLREAISRKAHGWEIDPKGSVIARRQKPEGYFDRPSATVMREPALGYAVDAGVDRTRALRRARS